MSVRAREWVATARLEDEGAPISELFQPIAPRIEPKPASVRPRGRNRWATIAIIFVALLVAVPILHALSRAYPTHPVRTTSPRE